MPFSSILSPRVECRISTSVCLVWLKNCTVEKLEGVPTCSLLLPCAVGAWVLWPCPCCFYQGSENKLKVWFLPLAFAPRWALGNWEWPCPAQVFLARYKERAFRGVGVQMLWSLEKRPKNLCATPIKPAWQRRAAFCNTACLPGLVSGWALRANWNAARL